MVEGIFFYFKLADIIARISRFNKVHTFKTKDRKKFEALKFDDETYYDSDFDLPRCSNDIDDKT